MRSWASDGLQHLASAPALSKSVPVRSNCGDTLGISHVRILVWPKGVRRSRRLALVEVLTLMLPCGGVIFGGN